MILKRCSIGVVGAYAEGSADGAAFGAQVTNNVISNVRTHVHAQILTYVLTQLPHASSRAAAPSRDLIAPA